MLRRESAQVGRAPWPSRRALCVIKGGVSISTKGVSIIKKGVSTGKEGAAAIPPRAPA